MSTDKPVTVEEIRKRADAGYPSSETETTEAWADVTTLLREIDCLIADNSRLQVIGQHVAGCLDCQLCAQGIQL